MPLGTPSDTLAYAISVALTAAEAARAPAPLIPDWMKTIGGAAATAGGVIAAYAYRQGIKEQQTRSDLEALAKADSDHSRAVDSLQRSVADGIQQLVKGFGELREELHEQRIETLRECVRKTDLEAMGDHSSEQFKDVWAAISDLRKEKAEKSACALHYSDRFTRMPSREGNGDSHG